MRVMVVRALEGSAGWLVIKSPSVSGSVVWNGDALPLLGVEVDVELDAHDGVDWGVIAVDPPARAIINPASDGLTVDGLVEDFDQYGVLTLRLAGGLMLFDTAGDPPIGIVGRRVRMVVPNVALYLSNL